MFRSRLDRIAGGCGILVVIMVIANNILSPGPSSDSSIKQIMSAYTQNSHASLLWTYEDILTVLLFVVFLGSLWALVRRAEGEPGVLSFAFLIGAAGFVAVDFMGQIVLGALAYKVAATGDVGVVRALYDVETIHQYFAIPLLGMVIGTASLAATRNGFLPRWVRWAGLPIAAFDVIAGIGVTDPSSSSSLGVLAVAGMILSLLWVLVTSVTLTRRSKLPAATESPSLVQQIAI